MTVIATRTAAKKLIIFGEDNSIGGMMNISNKYSN
jgi:hypothetical protein